MQPQRIRGPAIPGNWSGPRPTPSALRANPPMLASLAGGRNSREGMVPNPMLAHF